jgi:hypothetical protein
MSAAVTLHLTLPASEAWALAEFVKRVGYSDFRPLAVDADEAHAMQDAAERLRTALADAGYAPR